MLKHMKKIVYQDFRPFSFLDFIIFEVDNRTYKLVAGTIRNKFSQFVKEHKIEFCYKDKLAFYSLPRKKFEKDRVMTVDHTDILAQVNDINSIKKIINQHPIYKLINYIPFGKRSIHDLHLIFECKGIWEYFISIDYFKKRINCKNKSISFGYFNLEKYLVVNIKIHKKDTVSVIIKCSSNPIVLDPDGIMRLTEALTRVEERLAAILNDPNNRTFNVEYNKAELKIPNKDEWKIVLWHVNRDSLTEYSGKYFHCTWKVAKNLFIRVYIKELKLKTIVRMEIQEKPDMIFKNLLTYFINNNKKRGLFEVLNWKV